MSDGNIFYSQVDFNLQQELNARGRAGRYDRTNRALNYMLEKVANIEIIAMKNQKHIDLNNPDDTSNILHKLGGTTVRSGEYLPTGINGFLKERVTQITDPLLPAGSAIDINSSYRIAPFITSAEVQLNDHSMGLLNSATINIVIPNPDRDLDFMESVYARPGRAITMIIEHPDSAVITDQPLTIGTIQPKIKDQSANRKMNRISFNGLIKSFTYSYQIDGTVDMTVYLIGTSNVYTDVSMYMYQPNTPSVVNTSPTAPSPEPITFYKQIWNEIDSLYRKQTDPDVEVKTSYLQTTEAYENTAAKFESDDRWWIVMYDWNKKEQRYITLALLIKFINKYIISKQHSVAPDALIICSNLYCESNYLDSIVSANPVDIWLPGGNHDKYSTKKWFTEKNSNTSEPLNYTVDNHSYPSHIFINLNVIDRILTDLLKTPDNFKVTDFLIKLSELISESTGNFINMKLISYPEDPDYLIYYDSNYKGIGSYNVTPYSVPMFANHPVGTIVRDFNFTSTLPQNTQALMYTVNQSDTISEEKIAPFLNYMYNNRIIYRSTDNITGIQTERISSDVDPSIKAKLDEEYKKTHLKYLNALNEAKLKFSNDGLTNSSTQVELSNSLKKHVQWPTATIKDTSQMTAAVYPMEVEFTIDGINGFRYGDTVEFNALPAKYKNNTTFSIIGITHTVSTTGEWTTAIKCIMRPKFD